MLKPVTLTDAVYAELRRRLLEMLPEPGVLIDERTLASELGVSRTPLREALNRLEKDGLVEIVPRKGAFVARFTRQDVLDLFEARLALEPFIARLAAMRVRREQIAELERIFEPFRGFDRPAFSDPEIQQQYIAADDRFHLLIAKASANAELYAILERLRGRLRIAKAYVLATLLRGPESLAEHGRITAALKGGDPELAQEEMRKHIEGAYRAIEQHWAQDNPTPRSSLLRPGG